MNQKMKLSKGVSIVIMALAFLLFLGIWPLGVIQNKNISKSKEIELRESEPITVEKNGTQMFVAEGSFLESVELLVKNDMTSQIITFRLYDSAYTQLWETFHVVDQKERFPGFLRIPVELEMQEGWEYYYTVEGLTAPLTLSYEETETSGSTANGTHIYGGEKRMGVSPIIRYHYREKAVWWMVLLMVFILTTLAYSLGRLTDSFFMGKGSKLEREIRVQQLLQWTINPIIIVVTLVSLFYVFPGRKFGVGVINYGFYYLGITLAAAFCLIGINYKRKGQEEFLLGKLCQRKIAGWGMSVCFAGMLWACYEYMNGLYDIHHSYATCKFLTWFALAMLFTFKKENIFRLWNLVYLIPAVIYGYYYAKPYEGVVELDELYRLQARVIVVGGFLLLQILISLIQRIRKKAEKGPKLNLSYAVLVLTWAVFMLVFRNTRSWVVTMMVVAAILYYCVWNWEKREKLLQNFNTGVIFHFVYTVAYCLMHRPYLRFRHNRYGMVFHTVTMTGYYLALVLCAVMVSLFYRYQKTRRWMDCLDQLCLLGIANVYLFLTLSRTGYLAAFTMQFFMACFFAFWMEKKKILGCIRNLAVISIVSMLFFPIVFTAQRMLPAMYDDPIYSEIEIWDYVVEKGDPMDSELYIDIEAFMKVAGNKLFGIDMGNISLSFHEFREEWKKAVEPVYIQSDKQQLASEAEMYEKEDISNGRFDIFTEYIGHWNLTGHELMGVPMADGSMAAHAHNTFLQMIHDHGLITGVIFLLLGIVSFIIAIIRYKKEEEKGYLALTVAVLLAFAMAGMVEWVFHLCNPFGISLLVVIAPLLFQRSKIKNG